MSHCFSPCFPRLVVSDASLLQRGWNSSQMEEEILEITENWNCETLILQFSECWDGNEKRFCAFQVGLEAGSG